MGGNEDKRLCVCQLSVFIRSKTKLARQVQSPQIHGEGESKGEKVYLCVWGVSERE